jgi:hypothetical protein
VYESTWSEGDNKLAFPDEETRRTQEPLYNVEHELKDIRYQSKTYKRLETLMNRVNEESLKEEHRKQTRKKAVGVDGVTKDEYGKSWKKT